MTSRTRRAPNGFAKQVAERELREHHAGLVEEANALTRTPDEELDIDDVVHEESE